MKYEPIPLEFNRLPVDEMTIRAEAFLQQMRRRRSVRYFSSEPVDRGLIERAIMTASTAPNGANRQPWRFVAVSSPEIKREIRIAAEEEEKASYGRRMSQEWLDALEGLGTDWHKEFLEHVPWIVVCFAQLWEPIGDRKAKNYYVQESCGIACGLFIAAIHDMGLATLTHTPSPMGFLSKVLERPKHERPFMLFPVGYPSEDCTVPKISKKSAEEVIVWH